MPDEAFQGVIDVSLWVVDVVRRGGHVDVAPALQPFIEPGYILVQSDATLAERVQLQAKKLASERPAYKSWKSLREVSEFHGRMVQVYPLEVLHEIGRATVFQERSPLRDYQRLWAQLRYCDVFVYGKVAFGYGNRLLLMSKDGLAKRFHHKTTQSEYLGIGFAIVVAKKILEEQQPDYRYVAVDAEMALDAAFDLSRFVDKRPRSRRGTSMRPDYFLLGHRADGGRSTTRLVVLECKGTHSDGYAAKQMGKAAYQLDSVRVGLTTPPGLMVATVLSGRRIVAKLLDPEGDEELWSGDTADLDEAAEQLDLAPVEPSEEAAAPASSQPKDEQLALFPDSLADAQARPLTAATPSAMPKDSATAEVYPIPADRKNWFARILSRTAGAGALLFAGDAANVRRLVSERQLGYPAAEEPAVGAGMEERDTEFGSYVGTSHLIHWAGEQSVEIFHGVSNRLYDHLKDQHISRYVLGLGQQPAGVHIEESEVVVAANDGTVTAFRAVDRSGSRPRRFL
jgi:hypothetical protein